MITAADIEALNAPTREAEKREQERQRNAVYNAAHRVERAEGSSARRMARRLKDDQAAQFDPYRP